MGIRLVKCHKCGQVLPKEAVFCGYCGAKIRSLALAPATINTIKNFRSEFKSITWCYEDFKNKKGAYTLFVNFLNFLRRIPINELSENEELVEEVMRYKAILEATFGNISRCCKLLEKFHGNFYHYKERAEELAKAIELGLYEDEEEHDELVRHAESYIDSMKEESGKIDKYLREELTPQVDKFGSTAIKLCELILKLDNETTQ